MAIAHAVIEFTTGEGEDAQTTRYDRGVEVPSDIPGYDELVEAGSISDEPYDPEVEKPEPPDEIEIDGVVYVKASDGATNGERQRAAVAEETS
jgi:hypothetical protein